jgi:hypothetical protein
VFHNSWDPGPICQLFKNRTSSEVGLLALGRSDNLSSRRGYDLALECLREYANAWKEKGKVVYRNRELLKARKVFKSQEAPNVRPAGGWRRRRPLKVATANPSGHTEAISQVLTADTVPDDVEPIECATTPPPNSRLSSSRLDMRSRSVEPWLQDETRTPSPGPSTLNPLLDLSAKQLFEGAQDSDSHDHDSVMSTRSVTPGNRSLRLSLLGLGILFSLFKQNQSPA